VRRRHDSDARDDRRRGRGRARGTQALITLALVACVGSVPAAFGAWLLGAQQPAGALTLMLDGDTGDGPGAGAAADDAPPAESPLALGMLYARGSAVVDWNGTRTRLSGGSYAYAGGETVQVGPESMAVLQLGAAGTVFACPGSRLRVTRGDGAITLEVLAGTSRFMFAPDVRFRVLANGTAFVPAPRPAEAGGGPAVGEAVAAADGGCVLCQLRAGLRVEALPAGGPQDAAAVGVVADGGVLEVSAAGAAPPDPLADGAQWTVGAAGAPQRAVSRFPIPSGLLAGTSTAYAGGAAAPALLCRCGELAAWARIAALPASAAGPGPTPPAPPSTPPVPPPDFAPPPPGAPPALVAVPGAPGFDPTALPPPAAGPEPALIVLPPPAPGGGAGGGGVPELPAAPAAVVAPPVAPSAQGAGSPSSPS